MDYHKSPASYPSPITTPNDKDSNNLARLLAQLVNSASPKPPATDTSNIETRKLESWHDEDAGPVDESSYRELVDPNNSNGWSADDMFKYNEKMHKITSSYNKRTISDNYTSPLPKINSNIITRLATQLAKEIEDRVLAEGRVTPESSDDDELIEKERTQRVQKIQLDQKLKNLQLKGQCSINNKTRMNGIIISKATKKSSPQHLNLTSPSTASPSSNSTLNSTTIKPVTSSSRNILRTCLI